MCFFVHIPEGFSLRQVDRVRVYIPLVLELRRTAFERYFIGGLAK